MKKKIIIGMLGLSTLFVSCDVANQVLDTVTSGTGGSGAPKLTNGEVVAGLKEALSVGTNNSSGMASKLDGFYKNPKIKIPFPPASIQVKEKLEEKGLFQSQINTFVEKLNRTAEDAAKEAGPIFLNAIKNMSVQDGFNILKGGDHAATDFLKDKTTANLKAAFAPKVEASIDKVGLTKYWEPLANKYNLVMVFTGGKAVDPNLEDYVTDRAISGLFTLIADEETKIRKDPIARVSDLLKKVFGSSEAQSN